MTWRLGRAGPPICGQDTFGLPIMKGIAIFDTEYSFVYAKIKKLQKVTKWDARGFSTLSTAFSTFFYVNKPVGKDVY